MSPWKAWGLNIRTGAEELTGQVVLVKTAGSFLLPARVTVPVGAKAGDVEKTDGDHLAAASGVLDFSKYVAKSGASAPDGDSLKTEACEETKAGDACR
jgi:hypothetical protein